MSILLRRREASTGRMLGSAENGAELYDSNVSLLFREGHLTDLCLLGYDFSFNFVGQKAYKQAVMSISLLRPL
jgi:hypothetical protein